MADEVVAPAVRVLDNGYQAPNPIDYARLGLAQTQPMLDAIQQGNANRNALMLEQVRGAQEMQQLGVRGGQELGLAQLHGQQMMDVAKAQHQMQLQREAMRDNRILEAGKIRSQAIIDAVHERQRGSVLNQKLEYLVNQLGGEAPTGDPFSSDYMSKIDAATAERKQIVIPQDAKALAAIRVQRDALNKQKAGLDQDVSQADTATKGAYTQKALEDFMSANGFSPDADGVEKAKQAIQSDPNMRSDFSGRFSQARDMYRMQYLKDNGKANSATALADYNDRMRTLDAQERSISMMPSANGRMVPKPWLSEAQNLSQNDDWLKTNAAPIYEASKAVSGQSAGVSKSPAATPIIAAPAAGTLNPIIPPPVGLPKAEPLMGGTLFTNPTAPPPVNPLPAAYRGYADMFATPAPKPQPAQPMPGFVPAVPQPQLPTVSPIAMQFAAAGGQPLPPMNPINPMTPRPVQPMQQPPVNVIVPQIPSYPGAAMSPMTGNFQPISGFGATQDARADAIGDAVGRLQYMNQFGSQPQPIY